MFKSAVIYWITADTNMNVYWWRCTCHGCVDLGLDGAHGWRQERVGEAAQGMRGPYTSGRDDAAGNLLRPRRLRLRRGNQRLRLLRGHWSGALGWHRWEKHTNTAELHAKETKTPGSSQSREDLMHFNFKFVDGVSVNLIWSCPEFFFILKKIINYILGFKRQ